MRQLAIKCLKQINHKTIDENEIVEIPDDSDNDQIIEINDSNTKSQKTSSSDYVDSCVIVDNIENISQPLRLEVETCSSKSIMSAPEILPNISLESQVASTKEDIITNGVEHSLESTLSPILDNIKPEILENKDLTKMHLPYPPSFPEHDDISPESEIKCYKKKIKDLPLPPGKICLIN